MKELPLVFLLFLCGCSSVLGTTYDDIKTGVYRDGGTVWIEVKEKGRDKIEILCIDRQIRSKTRLEMFIGARHPKDDRARNIRGSERIEWIRILKKHLSKPSKEHTRFIEVLNEHIQYKKTKPVSRIDGSNLRSSEVLTTRFRSSRKLCSA